MPLLSLPLHFLVPSITASLPPGYYTRVRTGHGKPGKSWNLSISVSRPGKLWNLIVGYAKAWKIIVCVVRKLLQVSISTDKIKYRQVMSEDTRNKDDFRKWPLNFRPWKTRKSHGKDHGKSWDLKSSKEYEPCHNLNGLSKLQRTHNL